ncbi:MAG: homoserine kinase [Anaerolineae bacterium]|nr:homoserine kinase [Anaerolineae bacterium]
MTLNSATASAPATVANLGPGFDVLGLALAAPGDTVTVERTAQPGVTLTAITGDGGTLPTDPAQNTACVAAQHVLQTVAPQVGIALRLEKGLPLGSGLGSSAASAVAAAVATNALLGEPLSRAELLPACVEAEAVVSGRHADNVAPALLGGIVLVTGITAQDVFRLPAPPDLHLAVVTPYVSVSTSAARRALPTDVPLTTMVHQTAQVGLLVHALYTGDIPLLARAVGGDRVIEPARAHLMPLLREAQAAAREAGALTTIISGAGPTICALCVSADTAQHVSDRLCDLYNRSGIGATGQAATCSPSGAQVLAHS